MDHINKGGHYVFFNSGTDESSFLTTNNFETQFGREVVYYIEKNLSKIEIKINKLEKDLNEVQLDYFYLSSPDNLSKKINSLGIINYIPMDFSKIYLNYEDFITSQKKISSLRTNSEKKPQKK